MKFILYIISVLFTSFITGQEAAIQVYVKAVETGKAITNAKVTLEGYNLPDIQMRYDAKNQFYYAEVIPKGYNTVMAYHSKYNEKGFQNVQGLPAKLEIKMHDPRNVYYDFEYRDKSESPEEKYSLNLYAEDPYKIAIVSDSISEVTNLETYIQIRDYIFKEAEKLDVGIEPVNPYFEEYKLYMKWGWANQITPYPDLITQYGKANANLGQLIPLLNGTSTYDKCSPIVCYIPLDELVFYFRKKDGSKFKRYNDTILEKVRSIKGTKIYMVLNLKYNSYESKAKYKNGYTKVIDRKNRIYNEVDSSKIFFYKNNKYYTVKDNGRIKAEKEYFDDRYFGYQVLVGKEIHLSEYNINKQKINELELLYKPKGIGLGILDMYEYIAELLNTKFFIPNAFKL